MDRACDSALTMHEKRKLNRWKEPPWTARRAPGTGRSARAALALGRQSPASRCRAPDVSRRPPAVTAKAAPAGPRTRRPRAQDEARAVAAARRVEAPGSGQGRANSPAWRDWVGGGWETNAMRCECEGSDTGCQPPFPSGNDFWQPWKTFISSLRRMQVGSFVVALPCRRIRPPGHFVSPACQGAERVASPVCRASFDTRRHASATPSSIFPGPPCELPR